MPLDVATEVGERCGKQQAQWELDRRIPIALIAALVLQFLGGLWYLASLSQRVAALEGQRAVLEQRGDQQQALLSTTNERLARIEAQLALLIAQRTPRQ